MWVVGEVIHVWGQGSWNLSVPSLQFSCESETALKNKLLIKKSKKNTFSTEVFNFL